jgi:hypothetical protein
MPALEAIASPNGHGAAGAAPLAVPGPFRGKLLELVGNYQKAKADLDLFHSMMLMAMGLPPDSSWNLDTETMKITPWQE